MTTEEALKIIDQVLAQVTATRQQHAKIQEAVSVLKDAVESKG